MTYFGGEIPRPAGIASFDGAALVNVTRTSAAGMPIGAGLAGAMLAGLLPAGPPLGMPAGAASGAGHPMQPGSLQTEILRQQAAAVIQRCYRWLEAVAPTVPQVSALVPAMITAVQQYEAQQYGVCLNQAAAAAETIRQWQAAVAGLPAL